MYKYSLESLLNYTSFLEEIRQKELAVLKQNLDDEKNKLLFNEKERVRNQMKLEQKLDQGAAASEGLIYHKYIQRLRQDYDKQKKRVTGVEKKVDQTRSDLIEIMKKRKMLDKLKEKGLQAYTRNLINKEQKYLDEVAVNSFNNKNQPLKIA